MRYAALLVIAGCGRFGFGTHDTPHDAQLPDIASDAGVPGAAAWFAFEDTTPTEFVDSLGGASGACQAPGCPVTVPGRHGLGVRFDGVDDCIAVPDAAGHFSTQTISLAIWAYQTGHNAQMADSQFSKRVDIGGNAVNSWQIEDYGDDSVSFTSDHGGAMNVQSLSAMGAIQENRWQHLALTWDGATKRMYVDGVRVATQAQGAPIAYDTNAVRIGCDDNMGIGEPFTGTLDDFVVYDRVLTEAEVALLATL